MPTPPATDVAIDLASTYVILDGGSAATPMPGGPEFWSQLMMGKLPEVERGRLVTIHESSGDWPHWEMHPSGEELVVLLGGRIEFVLERDDREQGVELDRVGQTVIVPRGIWHTARSDSWARLLFITAGAGTEHRPAKRRELPAGAPDPRFAALGPGVASHLEIGVPLGKPTAEFFGALFGWTVHPMGDDSFFAQSSTGPVGIHPGDGDCNIVPYFAVDDLTDAVARVRQLGGTAPEPGAPQGAFGRFAECRDPQSVRFGLHERPRG